MINLIFGPVLNSARGIGVSVAGAVNALSSNFLMAVSPQITKSYSNGDIDGSRKLVYVGSKTTFFLLTIVSIPLLVNMDEVLALWLVEVPEYANYFVACSLALSLIYSVSTPVSVAIQATGKMKWFQIGVNALLLSELPFAWLLLKNGYPPFAVMYPAFVSYSVAIFYRFYLLRKYVDGYEFKHYILHILLRCAIVFAVSYLACKSLDTLCGDTVGGLIASVLLCICVTATFILIIGLNIEERRLLLNRVKRYLSNTTNN